MTLRANCIHSHAKGSAHNLSISEWRDYDIISRYADEAEVSPNVMDRNDESS